jgi:hypothetical protein
LNRDLLNVSMPIDLDWARSFLLSILWSPLRLFASDFHFHRPTWLWINGRKMQWPWEASCQSCMHASWRFIVQLSAPNTPRCSKSPKCIRLSVSSTYLSHSISQLKQLGFDDYIINLINGPDEVLAHICNQSRLNMVVRISFIKYFRAFHLRTVTISALSRSLLSLPL